MRAIDVAGDTLGPNGSGLTASSSEEEPNIVPVGLQHFSLHPLTSVEFTQRCDRFQGSFSRLL